MSPKQPSSTADHGSSTSSENVEDKTRNDARDDSGNDQWWRGGVIYQIYPRSFRDRNGDGIGDLPGITEKLEYIARLGVDAVWISPFFKSPMKDFGYDVSDYRDVDPIFGTLADFDALVARADELGLRVLIDQVLSHSSDQHAWFRDSRSARDSEKSQWYVWADPKPDGTPPNNWLAYFGGSAWEWDSRREQYYFHQFLASQPDLNFHDPEVTAQLLDDVEFWLKRGVSGFRLDTVNFFTHDPELRDNPGRDPRDPPRFDVAPNNPYAYQTHLHDKNRPENVAFLKRLRELLDRYPGSTTVGEIGSEDAPRVMAEYTSGSDKLHMAYAFELLTPHFTAGHIREVIETMDAAIGDGWVCWSLSNHDVARVLTRWGGPDASPGMAKVLLAMLLSLRGSVCLYQGEELGLPEAEVPYDRLQDPYGVRFWPEIKGRDGCRTPMPWTDAPGAGFSSARETAGGGVEPWLPIPDTHRELSVARQEADPTSVLATCRKLLSWRREIAALRLGSIAVLDVPEPALAWVREHDGDRVLAVFNLAAEPASLPNSVIRSGGFELAGSEPLTGHGFDLAEVSDSSLELSGYGVYFCRERRASS